MCPDRGLLSAYADGEVPSPWNARIAEHVAGCAACGSALERYASLGRRLSSEPLPNEKAIVARGRERLERELAARAAGRTAPAFGSLPRAGRAWGRSLSLPLPLAAAAALVLFLLAGLTTANLLAGGREARPALAAAEIAPEGAEQASMERILRYLDSQNAQVTLTINLPSETDFGEAGTPVIVRAPKVRPVQAAEGEAP
ncbi:MAG TPA: zf-HC2 domain-containing protein [Spirochaetales bacterium]|nr:zf-HC2 domain-containing protein [Spirochaetales bacterium]HRY54242.1 zf-HC2 domain-containing protein [Spirochaetia bacterium]